MQKNLLLLFMLVSCVVVNAEELYIDELIAKYREVFYKNGSDLAIALKALHDKEDNDLKVERDQKDSHQCNGWHIAQPDGNCVTGQMRINHAEEFAKKSKINNELHVTYENIINKMYNKIEQKKYIMLSAAAALKEDECDINNSNCFRKETGLTLEYVLSAVFFDEQDSVIYSDATYNGKLILTRDEKVEIIEKNANLKASIMQYEDAKKGLRKRINPELQEALDIKENQNDQGALSQ